MHIQYSRLAIKQITKLPQKIKENIKQRVKLLPNGDIKKLQNHKYEYRMRVGQYRVLFDMTPDNIEIWEIKSRGDAY
jgi:mRNA-degrading endonuclease RelE of RelBE toxin-antitoxin system